MKAKIYYPFLFFFLFVTMICACKKSTTTATNNDLTPINGQWQTTVFGGPNDTLNLAISSTTAKGIISYINPGAIAASGFAVNDVLFSNITATSSTTFTAIGTFKYNGNTTTGHANATLTLNNPTVLFVHYSLDTISGITPPDYYYYKM
jgi:hypothetical protein